MEEALLGTWRLGSWVHELANGQQLYPLGRDPIGYINYAPGGFVFVHIMAANRAPYAGGDPFNGSPEEDAAATKSHISYAGTFECRDGQVIHHVDIASFPSWAGTAQHRNARLDGDQLELSAEGLRLQGEDVTARLVWHRA